MHNRHRCFVNITNNLPKGQNCYALLWRNKMMQSDYITQGNLSLSLVYKGRA